MPNFWTLVWGPPAFRRFSAEIRFAEMRRGRISFEAANAALNVFNSLSTGVNVCVLSNGVLLERQ